MMQEFLEKHDLLRKCSYYDNKNGEFSKNTITMLTTILEQMNEVSSKVETISKGTRIQGRNEFPRGNSYEYFPETIKEHIEALEKTGYMYTFTIQERSYELFIMAPLQNRNSEAFFLDCARKVYMWLSVANYHALKQCSHKMKIYLYFTDLKKEIPSTPDSHIMQEHVNTAFTTSCAEVTEIHLSRLEEWFKVFIHETFHNMGLDFSKQDDTSSKEYILSIFPVESDVRIFETYCEMWGEIIYLLFLVYKKGVSIPEIIKDWCKKVKIEKVFSLFQCGKVLAYYNMNYEHLYERDDVSKTIRKHQYKEKTHVLSYYIIKSIQFFFMDEYIEWCVQHNGVTLQFHDSPTTIMEYCNFIKKFYLSQNYKNALKVVEDWFEKQDSKQFQAPEMRTLRMTIHG